MANSEKIILCKEEPVSKLVMKGPALRHSVLTGFLSKVINLRMAPGFSGDSGKAELKADHIGPCSSKSTLDANKRRIAHEKKIAVEVLNETRRLPIGKREDKGKIITVCKARGVVKK